MKSLNAIQTKNKVLCQYKLSLDVPTFYANWHLEYFLLKLFISLDIGIWTHSLKENCSFPKRKNKFAKFESQFRGLKTLQWLLSNIQISAKQLFSEDAKWLWHLRKRKKPKFAFLNILSSKKVNNFSAIAHFELVKREIGMRDKINSEQKQTQLWTL